MEPFIPLHDRLFWVGNNDRTTDLFESIWPLPRGVSYNSYLLVDEKKVLFDTVKNNAIDQYLEKLQALQQQFGPIDYLIIHHMEPDHSGAISVLRSIQPDLTIIGNTKTADLLRDFYGLSEHLHIVQDGEELSVGQNRLKFILTPMVHWPETMMTYETTRQILFSGDAFGGFGAMDGGLFDDEVDLTYYDDEILRYFSNIVGKYSSQVQKAIKKLQGLPIRMIASTHGPIWRMNPQKIIRLYDQWSSYLAEAGVLLAYGSMYGHTTKMVESIARGLISENMDQIRVHDVSRVHLSYLIRDAWKYQAIIFASPTYDMHLFPPMDQFIRLLEGKGLKNRMMGLVATYAWSGGGLKMLHEFGQKAGWTILEPMLEVKCSPTKEDLQTCFILGQNCARQLRERK